MWGHRRCVECGKQGYKVDMVKERRYSQVGPPYGPTSYVVWRHMECLEERKKKDGFHLCECGNWIKNKEEAS